MDPHLLEKILNISRRMAATRALTPLLDYVMDEAIKLVGAERGFMVLLQADGSLNFRIKRGRDGRELKNAEDQAQGELRPRAIHEEVALRTDQKMSHQNIGQNVKSGLIRAAATFHPPAKSA